MCKPFITFSTHYIGFSEGLHVPELRVVVSEKLNRILDEIVEEWGIYPSKAELMRSATIYLLMNLGVVKDLAGQKRPKKDEVS